MRHGIPPAEDGRGNPLPGIEPQRVDEVAAGQPAAASGRPGGGRCRSVEDADSGHGRSGERKEGHGPERGRMALVGWDAKTEGCPARLTSRDRTIVVEGRSGSGCVVVGGRRKLKKKKATMGSRDR